MRGTQEHGSQQRGSTPSPGTQPGHSQRQAPSARFPCSALALHPVDLLCSLPCHLCLHSSSSFRALKSYAGVPGSFSFGEACPLPWHCNTWVMVRLYALGTSKAGTVKKCKDQTVLTQNLLNTAPKRFLAFRKITLNGSVFIVNCTHRGIL